MDEEFLEGILQECGLIEYIEEVPDNTCCGVEMIYSKDIYYCSICCSLKNNDDYENTPSYSTSNRRIYSNFSNCPKSLETRKADTVAEFKDKLKRQSFILPEDLIDLTCEYLFKITLKNTKKASNRQYLFAELLRLASIETDNILTEKEVAKIVGLTDTKLSRGSKFIVDAILYDRVEINLSKPVYVLYIKKYLNAYNLNHYKDDSALQHENINTVGNRSYCINLVELMLDKNIAYNSTIQSKCIAVVYYLLRNFYGDNGTEKQQKKYFTSLVDVGESTFVKIYNTLISDDVYKIIIGSPNFKSSC
jgi:hypothetical protein